MTKEQIINYYELQINKAENGIEKSSIKFEMKKHLEAYENGKNIKRSLKRRLNALTAEVKTIIYLFLINIIK
jgi:hypothetical protein